MTNERNGDTQSDGIGERALRLREVLALTGVSTSTLKRYVREGTFPQGRRLGPGAVRWLATEVQAWLRSRPPHDRSC